MKSSKPKSSKKKLASTTSCDKISVEDKTPTEIKVEPSLQEGESSNSNKLISRKKPDLSSNQNFNSTSEESSSESASNSNKEKEIASESIADYMKNAILEEVLNEKKAALLQSPAIMKLLCKEQVKHGVKP